VVVTAGTSDIDGQPGVSRFIPVLLDPAVHLMVDQVVVAVS